MYKDYNYYKNYPVEVIYEDYDYYNPNGYKVAKFSFPVSLRKWRYNDTKTLHWYKEHKYICEALFFESNNDNESTLRYPDGLFNENLVEDSIKTIARDFKIKKLSDISNKDNNIFCSFHIATKYQKGL